MDNPPRDPASQRISQGRPEGRETPRLLTAAEFDWFTDVIAGVAAGRSDTTREEGVTACEVLDRLLLLRHLVTDPPDLRVGWRC